MPENIDISKVNEAIKIISNECVKHDYCIADPVCPFYSRDYAECIFKISDNPDGWDLIEEGDTDVGSEKQD